MVKHQLRTILVLSLWWWFFGEAAIVMAQRNNGSSSSTTTLPARVVVKVGAVLDVSEGMVGKIGLNSIRMCIHDFYVAHPHYKTRLQLFLRDSHRDMVTAAAQGSFYFSIHLHIIISFSFSKN
ncbi:hypothetical protein PIB30_029074 [Stylosanthes scabra]|uniref:Uncharacterized protein n=1 Tax=Stylosanthes scabra TaxID=79078 RepID=A0ABU6SAP0_9FABA|nr:hypothetical protein [Stylosanthes scabra]